MQLITDFLPLIIFFATYKATDDLFKATAALVVAVLVQTAVTWARTRKVSTMALVSAALVTVFGGLTVILKDDTFIKWKPTVVNWLFAAVFLGSHVVGERPVVERIMGEQLKLDRASWRRLSFAWVIFFILLGATNLVVAYTVDQATWVKFKVFGLLGLTVVFVLAQGMWLSSRAEPEAPDAVGPAPEATPPPGAPTPDAPTTTSATTTSDGA